MATVDDVLGYQGRRVVVTGAASGMGEAAAGLLIDVGAEVIALDVKPTNLAVAEAIQVDLGDQASIDEAVAKIGGPVDAVFSIAGLPGPPFSDLDTMTVNFVGARHLVESLVPQLSDGAGIVCVASNAGLGWQQEMATWLPLITTPDFASGKAWCEANPKLIASGYTPSKKVLNAWVAWRAATLIAERGIRLNCLNPGPTTTAMMPFFEEQAGKAIIDAFVGPSARRSAAVEQAWPMLFLNSPRSSYINGEALHVDGGFLGAMVTGQLQVELPEGFS
jgi:NAD(P)-dependent dehydrogenase (short-subunit alcohol dehydrogenase family)